MGDKEHAQIVDARASLSNKFDASAWVGNHVWMGELHWKELASLSFSYTEKME